MTHTPYHSHVPLSSSGIVVTLWLPRVEGMVLGNWDGERLYGKAEPSGGGNGEGWRSVYSAAHSRPVVHERSLPEKQQLLGTRTRPSRLFALIKNLSCRNTIDSKTTESLSPKHSPLPYPYTLTVTHTRTYAGLPSAFLSSRFLCCPNCMENYAYQTLVQG